MITIENEECLGCEICVEVCRQDALTMTDCDEWGCPGQSSGYQITVDMDRCNLCRECADCCPVSAITM